MKKAAGYMLIEYVAAIALGLLLMVSLYQILFTLTKTRQRISSLLAFSQASMSCEDIFMHDCACMICDEMQLAQISSSSASVTNPPSPRTRPFYLEKAADGSVTLSFLVSDPLIPSFHQPCRVVYRYIPDEKTNQGRLERLCLRIIPPEKGASIAAQADAIMATNLVAEQIGLFSASAFFKKNSPLVNKNSPLAPQSAQAGVTLALDSDELVEKNSVTGTSEDLKVQPLPCILSLTFSLGDARAVSYHCVIPARYEWPSSPPSSSAGKGTS